MTVTATGLECRYPGTRIPAVSIDSFALDIGTTGLVGVNGAGKTTLIRTLAGLRRPERGAVLLEGVDLYGPRRRTVIDQVGYLPQHLMLPPEVRVVDALRYVAWVRRVPRRTAEGRIARLLETVGLAARRNARVGTLSGGMHRRLAFAASLLTDPSFILLDEPTTGLDPAQRAVVRDLVAGLSGTATVLMSSHLMEDVEQVAPEIVVLDEGAMLRHGSTAELTDELGGPERSAELAFLSLVSRARS